MWRLYIAAGFDPSGFWDLTPVELRVHFDAAGKRREAAQVDRIWAVWHVAALQRAKHMPTLKSMMPPDVRRQMAKADLRKLANILPKVKNGDSRRS